MRPLMNRFYQWISSWHLSPSRKSSSSSVVPSTSSNGSNFSYESTVSALKGDKLTSSNVKKVVRFAEENGEVLAQVLNNNEQGVQKTVEDIRPMEESLGEVYIKDGLIRGFINVKNLESGRQVLVRYTDDNWAGFKQVTPRLVEIITDSKGKRQIKLVKEKRKMLRRRQQVNPSADRIASDEKTYFFKIGVDQTKLKQVELVVISSLNNVIDTNHRQCYSFKCVRRSWEANGSDEIACPRQRDINGRTFSRQL